MRWLNRVTMAMIAVLLPTGVLATMTVDSGTPQTDGRVGAASLAHERLAEEPPVTMAPARVTTAAPPPPAVVPRAPTTATAPRRTVTTTPAAAGGTALVPGLPLPRLPLPDLPTIPILQPPVTSWSSTSGPVSARMRMEPATPAPGQPVRFYVDIVANQPCCAMSISYGDRAVSPNPSGSCASPTSRTTTFTHTFAAPGDYELLLAVTTFPCKTSVVDGQFVPPPVYGTSIKACIGVGRLLGPPSCTPYNHFGPDKVVSGA